MNEVSQTSDGRKVQRVKDTVVTWRQIVNRRKEIERQVETGIKFRGFSPKLTKSFRDRSRWNPVEDPRFSDFVTQKTSQQLRTKLVSSGFTTPFTYSFRSLKGHQGKGVFLRHPDLRWNRITTKFIIGGHSITKFWRKRLMSKEDLPKNRNYNRVKSRCWWTPWLGLSSCTTNEWLLFSFHFCLLWPNCSETIWLFRILIKALETIVIGQSRTRSKHK